MTAPQITAALAPFTDELVELQAAQSEMPPGSREWSQAQSRIIATRRVVETIGDLATFYAYAAPCGPDLETDPR